MKKILVLMITLSIFLMVSCSPKTKVVEFIEPDLSNEEKPEKEISDLENEIIELKKEIKELEAEIAYFEEEKEEKQDVVPEVIFEPIPEVEDELVNEIPMDGFIDPDSGDITPPLNGDYGFTLNELLLAGCEVYISNFNIRTISPSTVHQYVINQGFGDDEAFYCLNNINIDWYEQAYSIAYYNVTCDPSLENDIYDILIDYEFTLDQAQYAIDRL